MPGGEYLIQDPVHRQATDFIDVLHRRWGLRAVCFWTDGAAQARRAWQHPALRSAAVAAHYAADLDELPLLADVVRRRHDVVAVVPWREPVVAPAERLAELLGLSWAQPDVLPLFRDKFALKERLRALPAGPRVNAAAVVRSVDDVVHVLAAAGFDRYVLKPVDGFANVQVGFFDRGSDPVLVAAHLARIAPGQVLLEEYVDGVEYYVNGQVDAHGVVVVTRVGRYERISVNGKANVEVGTSTVHTDDPAFDRLAAYAVEVVQATGLRRSPFHLEAKVDDRGPCLIEVAARLVGGGEAIDDGLVHGGRFDAFVVAAHYYLTADPYGDLGLDWATYDRSWHGHVCGVATDHGRMYEVQGTHEVEAMPEFARWVIRPRVGDRIEPTVDLGGMPYQVVLRAPTAGTFAAAVERVRRTVQWNDVSGPLVRTLRRPAALAPVAARAARQRWHQRDLRPVPVREA